MCPLVGSGLILLGLLFSFIAAPMLLNSLNDARDRAGGIAGGVIVLTMVGTGIWLIYRRYTKTLPMGVKFFRSGVEYGPKNSRQRFLYTELEDIWIEPVPPPSKWERTFDKINLTFSIASGNFASMGYALGVLNREEIESFIYMTPPGECTIIEAILNGYQFALEKAVRDSCPDSPHLIRLAGHPDFYGVVVSQSKSGSES